MREQRLALYDRLIASNPKFERKGKAMPYTSANGHMFSQVNKDGEIGIRLSPEAGRRFMEDHGAEPFTSYGAVMKGYVTVPDHMLADIDTLSRYLESGYEYVMSLKPKASKT